MAVESSEMRETVRKIAAREIPPFQSEDHFGTVPRELFSKFSSAGLAGLAVSERWGGIEAGPAAVAAAIEEISRVDLGPAIFLGVHGMVCGLIDRFGSEELKSRFLPRLANGELLGAFALTEAGAGSDAAALKTTARESGEGVALTGDKIYITSAGFADVYIVFAKEGPAGGERISAFIVEAGTSGMDFSPPERKMGCELSPIASVSFQNAKVPGANRLGEPGSGYKIALSGLAGGRVNIAACALGLSASAIDIAVGHLKQREQFGRKLIEFQGLQFILADLKMQLEAARLLTRHAAEVLQRRGSPDENLHASIAKCFASDAAMKITTDAVQLLGGAGYIREYRVEQLMRDAKMLQIVEGTNQIQRVIIAREMVR